VLFLSRMQLVMIELTNLCNLRCIMCGIWEERPNRVFALERYARLLRQRTVRNARVLALTGGEPFMLGDLAAYADLARELSPRSHVNVSSNGWYTERTLDFLARTDRRRTSLTISYDGLRSHDAIRRVEGSRERLLETARQVRARYPEVALSLKMTITNENHGEILDTARECRELGIPFRVKTLEKLKCHQGRFPSPVTGPEYDDAIVASIVAQARRLLELGFETNRAYVADLVDKYGGADAPCSCSSRTLFAGIDGKVFLCRRRDPIGDLGEQDLDAIWASPARHATVRAMAGCRADPLGLGFRHA
jgi:MoaA/NifB/PqqE/SkfB family radical SAM enzyme